MPFAPSNDDGLCTLALQEELDEASFSSYKSGLMAKLLEKDPSLQHETNRLWNQIINKRYYWYAYKLVWMVNCQIFILS